MSGKSDMDKMRDLHEAAKSAADQTHSETQRRLYQAIADLFAPVELELDAEEPTHH